MRFRNVTIVLLMSACMIRGAGLSAAAPQPATMEVSGLRFPAVPREKVFSPAERKAGFTFFDGVENVRVEDGVLKFSLTGKKATLGWGNYLGKQPAAEVPDMWEEQNTVLLDVRQSGAASDWSVRWWCDGARQMGPVNTKLSGTEPATLRFDPTSPQVPTPDGLEMEITGSAGDRIEIRSVKLVQNRCEGYARKEFTVPAGKMWRAVAYVGGQPEFRWMGVNRIVNRFYLNGREVKRRGTRWLYGAAAVDVTEYLRPGVNCAAFYGYRVGVPGYPPFLMAHVRVVMETGETASVWTDTTWKHSPQEARGWNQPGFDDSAWEPVKNLFSYMGAPKVPVNEFSVVSNPDGKYLFYSDSQDVRLEVRVPKGLKSRSPSVGYVLARADSEGKCTTVKEGRESAFAEKGDSLVFGFSAGRYPRGIYTLTLKVEGTGGVIEDRAPEPVVVVRKIPFREIAGRDAREGLDLHLEDTIDFANPSDPHPWFETETPAKAGEPWQRIAQPSIVRKGDLVYRESAGFCFSYRFQFQKPGSFYLMELDYPDDADREFDVSISTKYQEMWSNSQSGVGVHTGGKLFKSGKMQTLRWIHVADPGVHSVDICNIGRGKRPGTKAAARSLRIYRIDGDLPSVAGGAQRQFGIHTERCWDTSGIGMNFGIGQHKTRTEREEEEKKYTAEQRTLRHLQFLQDTTERYVQYLKFTGQNTHIMGVIQYNDDNTPFERPWEIENARVIPSMKSMLAHTLDVNGLSFYAGVEWSQFRHVSANTFANNAQLARGAKTYWMVNAQGGQVSGASGSTMVANWLLAETRERFEDLFREIGEKFGHLKGFQGIWMPIGPAQLVGYWPPGFVLGDNYGNPLELSYDDETFRLFSADTGIRLPVREDDPLRFQKRAGIVKNPKIRRLYMDWRCRKLREFLHAGLKGVQSRKPDARMLCALWLEEPAFFNYWLSTGREYGDLLKDYGIDLALLNSTPGITVGRWTISWRQAGTVSPTQDPLLWLAKVDPGIAAAYGSGPERYVQVRTSWEENGFCAPGYTHQRDASGVLKESDWIMDYTKTRTLPQPGGIHSREPFIQALITADANRIFSGMTDLNINVGNEQEIREVMKILTYLPPDRFQPVLNTGLDTNLAVRRLEKDGKTYLYAANPGYWSANGTLVLKGAAAVLDLVTERPVACRTTPSGVILPVNLAPFGLAAFVIPARAVTVESYTLEPISAQEKAHMEGIIGRVRSLVSDPEIRLVLDPDTRIFVQDVLDKAGSALNAGEYARAWSLLTGTRFWRLWQEFLEKAAKGLALLPAGMEKEQVKKKDTGSSITALRARDRISLDGKLDDPDWQRVKFQATFVDKENRPALAETGVKVLYDDQAVYFGFVCADRDISKLSAGKEFSWYDDCVDIFLQPDQFRPVYYQLGVNAGEVLFHQKVIGGERDYTLLPGWTARTARAEKFWTVEVRIPFETLGLKGPGSSAWRVNFHRMFRGQAIGIASWSHQPGDLHRTAGFGRLAFDR